MDVMELRQDPITGLYVAIAEGRSKRPNGDFLPENPKALPDKDPECFFCPGNEHTTPPERWAYRQGGFWWVREIPNKFPIFSDGNGLEQKIADAELDENRFYNSRPINGRHDIIVDTPRHNEEFHQRDEHQIRESLWFYKELLASERNGGQIKYVLIFKNRGKLAAASLEHPHTQFIVSPVPMPEITDEIAGASRYFIGENHTRTQGQCGYCAVILHELQVKDKHGVESDKHRIVDENPFFVAFAPYASRTPFEMTVIPKMHQANYDMVGEEEATHLAKIVQNIFRKLERTFPNVSYNFGLHTAPLNSGIESHYHWHLEVAPVLKRDGGLERFGRIPVNPVSPERAAYTLNLNHQP